MRTAFIQLNDYKHNDKLIELYANLTKHEGDAGLDLFCLNGTVVPYDGTPCKIDLGFSMVIAVDQKPVAFQLLVRSSTFKTGIMQCNCVGIVDAGYRGNLMVPAMNIHKSKTVIVNPYDRLFQAVPFDGLGVERIVVLDESESLEDMFPSDRGAGGFGSTGS